MTSRYGGNIYLWFSTYEKVPAAVKQVGRINHYLHNIPPTRDALLQHVKHASYQDGHVWVQSFIADPCLVLTQS